MEKTKTIELINLDNEELKKIVKVNCYNADIIKILYKNFSQEEIENKIISMGNVLSKLAIYIYSDDPDINKFPIETEDEKFWIKAEYDGNKVDSVEVNIDEVIDIIKLLNNTLEYIEDADIKNALIDLVQLKIDETYMFRKHYGKGKAYFNYNLTIVTEDVDTKLVKEYPVIEKESN